jgi:hypothetical protein
METLFGIAVVGVWIAISVVALKRAYGSRGPSPEGFCWPSPEPNPTVRKEQQP